MKTKTFLMTIVLVLCVTSFAKTKKKYVTHDGKKFVPISAITGGDGIKPRDEIGKAQWRYVDCPMCYGTGSVTKTVEERFNKVLKLRVQCPKCKGTGKNGMTKN